MALSDKAKAFAWTCAKNGFAAGMWRGFPEMDQRFAVYELVKVIPTLASKLAAGLDAKGCFADTFGETGSTEVVLCANALNGCAFGFAFHGKTLSAVQLADVVFDVMRKLKDAGMLTASQIANSVALAS